MFMYVSYNMAWGIEKQKTRTACLKENDSPHAYIHVSGL
jgi:hypothetical protein